MRKMSNKWRGIHLLRHSFSYIYSTQPNILCFKAKVIQIYKCEEETLSSILRTRRKTKRNGKINILDWKIVWNWIKIGTIDEWYIFQIFWKKILLFLESDLGKLPKKMEFRLWVVTRSRKNTQIKKERAPFIMSVSVALAK
jgi:hypothetical protein